MDEKTLVGIIMGSDSDLPVMQDVARLLEEFGVAYEITIVSAHRTPERMVEYAKTGEEKGLKVIIAGAGGAAHLPGMVASFSSLPVIGVPIKTSSMDGLDSVLSIVQMPPGIPVATVAVNGAKNAGLLAVEILGTYDKKLQEKIKNYKESLKDVVMDKVEKLQREGYKKYLESDDKS